MYRAESPGTPPVAPRKHGSREAVRAGTPHAARVTFHVKRVLDFPLVMHGVSTHAPRPRQGPCRLPPSRAPIECFP